MFAPGASDSARGHIEGAILIPVDELQARAAQELPREAEIILYCHSGVRSSAAARFLAQVGYTDVANLSGGFAEWQKNCLPAIRD